MNTQPEPLSVRPEFGGSRRRRMHLGRRHGARVAGIAGFAAIAALSTAMTAAGTGDGAHPLGPTVAGSTPVTAETAQLEQLYQLAVAEGGTLVVAAGGDAPDQQDALVAAFERRFPLVDIDVRVDLSKHHNIRINADLRDGGDLAVDVAMLQTTFNFDRWKANGDLVEFIPTGFEHQLPGYSDPDGAFVAANVFSFVPTYAADPPGGTAPTSYLDFLGPEYAGKLALTLPNDDDAVLYVYDALEKRFGTSFLERLRDQHPTWVRGTAAPAALIGTGPEFLGNVTGYGTDEGAPSKAFTPIDEPFLTWIQRAALFEQSDSQAAGRLFLAFLASAEHQSVYPGWRTRDDVPPPDGLRPLASYANTSTAAFTEWMSDRAAVAATRDRMEQLFGAVTGESPLLDLELLAILGLDPSRATALPAPDGPIE